MPLPKHKTKLVATIGPASESPEMLERLFGAGLNMARVNFSHGDFARDWVREHQIPGAVAMLVAGPSTRNPDANHRIEFLRVGEKLEKVQPLTQP